MRYNDIGLIAIMFLEALVIGSALANVTRDLKEDQEVDK